MVGFEFVPQNIDSEWTVLIHAIRSHQDTTCQTQQNLQKPRPLVWLLLLWLWLQLWFGCWWCRCLCCSGKLCSHDCCLFLFLFVLLFLVVVDDEDEDDACVVLVRCTNYIRIQKPKNSWPRGQTSRTIRVVLWVPYWKDLNVLLSCNATTVYTVLRS